MCTAKTQNMGVTKTSDHIGIKIKMPNPSQEPPVSSEAQNDMDVLCSFKIKIRGKKMELRGIKGQ